MGLVFRAIFAALAFGLFLWSIPASAEVTCDDLLYGSVNPTEDGGTDDFIDLFDHIGGVTEASEDNYLTGAIARTRRLHDLRCEVDVAPGAGNIWTMTVRSGAAGALADTILDCVISDTSTSCVSNHEHVDVGPNQALTIGVDSSAGASDPDAAGLLSCSVCIGE